jgi:hypothetical protein
VKANGYLIYRLTEEDIAFQLQFAEEQEQEQQSILNEGGYPQNVGQNATNIQKNDNPLKGREAELTNEERAIMFKVTETSIA